MVLAIATALFGCIFLVVLAISATLVSLSLLVFAATSLVSLLGCCLLVFFAIAAALVFSFFVFAATSFFCLLRFLRLLYRLLGHRYCTCENQSSCKNENFLHNVKSVFWFYNQLSKLLDGKDSKILQSNGKKMHF